MGASRSTAVPTQAKPLFRPDVLRAHLAAFAMPVHVDALRPKLRHWADLLASGRANAMKEQELLPDFLTDFFCGLLGYTRPADGGPRYTLSREKHVEVDGKFADAVLDDRRNGGIMPPCSHTRLGRGGTLVSLRKQPPGMTTSSFSDRRVPATLGGSDVGEPGTLASDGGCRFTARPDP